MNAIEGELNIAGNEANHVLRDTEENLGDLFDEQHMKKLDTMRL